MTLIMRLAQTYEHLGNARNELRNELDQVERDWNFPEIQDVGIVILSRINQALQEMENLESMLDEIHKEGNF